MATQSLLLIAVFLYSLTRSLGDVIEDGPRSTQTQPGHWSNFTCTVSCAYNIQWYVESYRGDITTMCGNSNDNMMVCTSIVQDCSTSMSTSGRTGQLSVLANDELAGSQIAVQCVASIVSDSVGSCDPSVAFSRVAYLIVEEEPTPEPTPVVCPTPSLERETVTETVRETVILTERVTVTKTVVATVNGPECTPSATSVNQSSGERRLLLTSVLRELFTWLCTILTGLAFL